MRQEGDWVFCVVDADDAGDAKTQSGFSLGYRSWAPVTESGFTHAQKQPDGFRSRASQGEQAPTPVEGDYTMVISYGGAQTHVEVPEVLGGHPVRRLHNKVFYSQDHIESVSLPDCVTQIGLKVFSNCRNLVRVHLSDSITELDALTFSGCKRLAEVHLPAALRVIERRLLSDCPLTQLHVPQATEELKDQSLNLSKLECISVDEGNVSFSTDGLALYDASGTTLLKLIVPSRSYVLRPGCIAVADAAFKGHSELQAVEFSRELAAIGNYAFFGTGLRAVDFPGGLLEIGERAFCQCDKLEEAVFPEGLAQIDDFAFSQSALSAAALPATLRKLGRGAFSATCMAFGADCGLSIDPSNRYLCTDGSALYARVDDGLVLMGAFEPRSRYEALDSTVAVAAMAFARDTKLESIVLPSGCERVGERAFWGCTSLCSCILPDSMREIGEQAFANCALDSFEIGPRLSLLGSGALAVGEQCAKGAPRIHVDDRNSFFYLLGGLVCEKGPEYDTALAWDGVTPHVLVPPAACAIAAHAFAGARVKTLSVHEQVSIVSPSAFDGLVSLDTVFVEVRDATGDTHEARVEFPGQTMAASAAKAALAPDDDSSFFRFADYDAWVLHFWLVNRRSPVTTARMVLARLDDPVKLLPEAKSEFDKVMKAVLFDVFRYYTKHRDFGGFERLERHGYLDPQALETMLEDTRARNETEATGYLMEMRNRRYGIDDEDFSL